MFPLIDTKFQVKYSAGTFPQRNGKDECLVPIDSRKRDRWTGRDQWKDFWKSREEWSMENMNHWEIYENRHINKYNRNQYTLLPSLSC